MDQLKQLNQFKTCKSCKLEFPKESFMTSNGNRSPSCKNCRILYIKTNIIKDGFKNCITCHSEKPLDDFKNKFGGETSKEYVSCHNCRVTWYNNNKRTQ